MLKVTMHAKTPRVHDPLGDALVIEVEDLLAEMEVFEQGRAAQAELEGVLIVGDWGALLGGQDLDLRSGDLVGFLAGALDGGDSVFDVLVVFIGHCEGVDASDVPMRRMVGSLRSPSALLRSVVKGRTQESGSKFRHLHAPIHPN